MEWKAEVKNKLTGELVYGNQGQEKFKESFEFALSTFSDEEFNKTLVLVESPSEKVDRLKVVLKNKTASTKDRLDSLIEYLGLDI